jgi:acetyl-CoA C-acetyltransferase
MMSADIASAVRSPVGRRGGVLRDAHAGQLLGAVIAEAIRRAGIPAEAVDQVLAGCVTQVGDQAYNVGRIAWLTAGLPETVPASTIDAQCGSSHQAVNLGASLIASGAAEVIVACGVDVMSRHPLGSNVAAGPGEPMGELYRDRFEVTNQGEAAERIADRWGIDRAACDEFAVRSQSLAADAWDRGNFDHEVVGIDQNGAAEGTIVHAERDEGLRLSTIESLGGLRPVFRPDGVHTAASSSQISDGASAMVLVSGEAAERYGIETLATLRDHCIVGVDPVLKLIGPIPATRRILDRTGLTIDAFDIFEVNEAFASVVLAWERDLAPDSQRVNVNGGAIAIGHPVGATGTRLCGTAVHELRRRGGGRALVTMCCGGGLGTASVIEVGC